MLGGAVLATMLHLAGVAPASTDGTAHPAAYQLRNAMGNITLALLLATEARYVRRGILSHFQMQQLHAPQLETELSLLKAPVNQHFLFNTLNNLSSLSLAAPDQMLKVRLLLAETMKQMESQLPAGQFIRIHKSYLVNRSSVEHLSGNVLLVGAHELPVGSTYRQKVLRHLHLR